MEPTDHCRAAFVKRSHGRIKKAEELSTLCDAEVCFLISDDDIGGGKKLCHCPEGLSQVHRVIYRLPNIEIKNKNKKKNEAEFSVNHTHGRELDQKTRDGFHMYIEARGVNEKLFPFLQAWLYVKDHRSLMNWFKRVGTFISEPKAT